MPKVFKNISDTAELVIFIVLGVICLAGIIRFVVLADIF